MMQNLGSGLWKKIGRKDKRNRQKEKGNDASPAVSDPALETYLRKHESINLLTKTLAHVHQKTSFAAVDNFKTEEAVPQAQRQAITISDAIAHLIVAQHDIVAITSRYLQVGDGIDGGKLLDILACMGNQASENPQLDNFDQPHSDKEKPPDLLEKIKYHWQLLVARNPPPDEKAAKKQDLQFNSAGPEIHLPERPRSFIDEEGVSAYLKKLTSEW